MNDYYTDQDVTPFKHKSAFSIKTNNAQSIEKTKEWMKGIDN